MRSKLITCFLLLNIQIWASAAWCEAIRIGSITNETVEELRLFQPLADYLASNLEAEGIDQGVVVVTNTMQGMAKLLLDDRIDLYMDSPFPTITVNRLAGSQALLRRWKKGGQGISQCGVYQTGQRDRLCV